MKSIWYFVVATLLISCGYDSVNNEAIGQFKKAQQVTPLICPNRYDVDISLGVMINGVGSMSHEDLWLTVESEVLFKEIQKAVESGKVYKITYNNARFRFCQHLSIITSIEVKE